MCLRSTNKRVGQEPLVKLISKFSKLQLPHTSVLEIHTTVLKPNLATKCNWNISLYKFNDRPLHKYCLIKDLCRSPLSQYYCVLALQVSKESTGGEVMCSYCYNSVTLSSFDNSVLVFWPVENYEGRVAAEEHA